MNTQLSGDDKQFIRTKARTRRFDKNWPVVHQGEESDAFFLILDGQVEVSCQHGGKRTLLCRLGPGDTFGELGLLTGNPRSASVMAIKPSTLAVLSKRQFDVCIQERPSVREALVMQISHLVNELTEKLNVNAEVAYRRLRYFLYKLGRREEEGLVIQDWSQEELAQLANCARESITKLLGDLEQGGWIRRESKPRRIVILKDLPERY